MGNRVSGSANLKRAVQYMLDALGQEAGLEGVAGEAVMVPHWVRGREEGVMLAPRHGYRLNMLGLGGSVGTGGQQLVGDVLVVSDWEELEARGAKGEVEGKVSRSVGSRFWGVRLHGAVVVELKPSKPQPLTMTDTPDTSLSAIHAHRSSSSTPPATGPRSPSGATPSSVNTGAKAPPAPRSRARWRALSAPWPPPPSAPRTRACRATRRELGSRSRRRRWRRRTPTPWPGCRRGGSG